MGPNPWEMTIPQSIPQMISNSVGNVGVSISQWLRDKAVTRQVNTHTYIYDYICICIRICGCVVYNIMWLYVSEWGHPPLYAQLLLGGNSRFFNSRSNQDEHPNQYTLESSRIGKPSKWPEFLRLTSRRIRNHGLHRKKNGCIVFIESSLCWIQCLTRSLPVILWFLAFYPWFLDPFPCYSPGWAIQLKYSRVQNSPQRRRKTSHLATLWVFKVWKTMENHHFLLGLSFINGHLYHQ